MVLLLSCQSVNSDLKSNVKHDFNDYYNKLNELKKESREKQVNNKYTFSASNMNFREFSFWFVRKTGKGLVYSRELDEKTISVEFFNANIEEIINAIAQRFDVKYELNGNTYFIGNLKDEESSYYVRKVNGLKYEDLKTGLETLKTTKSKLYLTSQGILFYNDRASNIKKIENILDELEKIKINTWIVQFFIIQFVDDKSFNFGMENVTSGDISLFLKNFLKPDLNFGDLAFKMSAVLSGKDTGSKVISSPMVIVSQGSKAVWNDGSEIPVPNKTVSDSGTVTTSGFTRLQTGLQIECTLYETSQGALMDMSLEDSSILNYIEYSPVLNKIKLQSQFQLNENSVYLIGELRRKKISNGLQSLFSWEKTKSDSRVCVYTRIYRITDFKDLKTNDKSIPKTDRGESVKNVLGEIQRQDWKVNRNRFGSDKQ